MKKMTVIVATSLILLGGILFCGVMTVLNWDFSKLSTVKYVTNEHVVTEAFESVSIVTETADITLVPSEDGRCRVVCHEASKIKHTVAVQNGVLSIEIEDKRKWYEHIGFDFGDPTVTVYLPSDQYKGLTVRASTGDTVIPSRFGFESIDVSVTTGDVSCRASATGELKLATSTGDLSLENLSAGSLDLSVSTGDVYASGVTCEGDVRITVSTGDTQITNLSCNNLSSSGSTGGLYLSGVIACEKMSLTRSTGNMNLDFCDAAELYLKTDTGDISGSLLSEKVFWVTTDTGDVNVPNSVTGGRCEVVTDTGDVQITVR